MSKFKKVSDVLDLIINANFAELEGELTNEEKASALLYTSVEAVLKTFMADKKYSNDPEFYAYLLFDYEVEEVIEEYSTYFSEMVEKYVFKNMPESLKNDKVFALKIYKRGNELCSGTDLNTMPRQAIYSDFLKYFDESVRKDSTVCETALILDEYGFLTREVNSNPSEYNNGLFEETSVRSLLYAKALDVFWGEGIEEFITPELIEVDSDLASNILEYISVYSKGKFKNAVSDFAEANKLLCKNSNKSR